MRYTDPTGMWIDNEDGTYTAEDGLYGDDWQSKSGFTRDPTSLQVGETVGTKQTNSLNNQNQETKTILNFSFSKWSYIPIEGIGVNGGSNFTGSAIMTDSSLSIFASGFFASQNLVDEYMFFGDATLYIDGMKTETSYFNYPEYSFISNGPPFTTIGDAMFYRDFSNINSVEVELNFKLGISVDSRVNKRFVNYSNERIKIK